MYSKIDALIQGKADLVKELNALLETADAEDRDLTAEEMTKFDAIEAKISDADKRIERARKVEAMNSGLEVPAGASIDVVKDRIEDDPKHGFKTFADFALAVKRACNPAGAVIDSRLNIGAAPTTYGNEGSGPDGGYLVPEEFSMNVREHSLEGDALLPLTDNDEIQGNAMSFPADETVGWGTDGIRAYWEAEAAQATQTKPLLKKKRLEMHKLFALVPVTDELLSDASALSGYLSRKTGESIRWKTNDAIINGTGAGQPEGIATAAALVTQAKETSQTAATINATNIAKMFARCTNPQRGVWIVNQDAWHQLPLMTIGDQPIWIAPNGFQQAPGGTLMGRPVIMSQTCQTLGTAGDIYFIDFMGYKTITKPGGIQTAQSIHLFFDYDVTAFRATFRVDGQPWPSAAISPKNGSNTLSPFVNLATRS